MYIPKHFQGKTPVPISEMLIENRLCTLITPSDNQTLITHLPVILLQGKLYSHIANSNPHLKGIKKVPSCTLIINGPQHYISPSWYLHEDVPTWNYSVIHINASIDIVSNEQELLNILQETVITCEKDHGTNWQMNLDNIKSTGMLNRITGFEIKIRNIQYKEKLSQNKDEKEKRHLIGCLKQRDSDASRSMADMIESKIK